MQPSASLDRQEAAPESPAVHPIAVIAAAVLVAIAAAPVLASGLDALGHTWHPAGDWSVLELRARDVGSSSTPLVGPYSRFGWNHPGPLLFWILAVPYRLSGQVSTGLLLSAALINIGAIIGLAVFLWRRGQLALVAATAAGVGLLCVHLGPSFLRDPWNPSITVLPFALVVVLAWSAWEGDRLALPLLAFGGSFLVQSHVGFAAMVLVLWIVGGVGFVRRREHRRRSVLWITAAVFLVCWVPVIIDQLAGTGNLGELVGYFGGGSGEDPAGWSTALGVMARELGGLAPWLGGTERAGADGGVITASVVALALPLAAFAGSLVLAQVRSARSAVRFQVVVAATSFAGFVSVARITGPVYAYLVRWLWILALLWWLSVFWSLWSSLSVGVTSGRSVRRWALAGLAVVALVVAGRASLRTVSGLDRIGMPDGEWYVTIDDIVEDVVAKTPREGPVLVRAVGSNNGSVADALRLQLDRNSIPVVVEPNQVHKYGTARSVRNERPVAVMTVATGAALAEPFGAAYGTVVARWDPLEPEDRRFANLLDDRLADQLSLVGRSDLVTALRSGGSLNEVRGLDGVDQELFDAVERYRRRGDPVTVYVDEASPTVSPGS